MNVSHYFELVEGERYMNVWAVNKFGKRFFIKTHYEMFEEYLILMRSLKLSNPLPARDNVIELILLFARAFRI